MWRRAAGLTGLVLGSWLFSWGCSSNDSTETSSTSCTPGEQKSCACGGGVLGYQICSGDGRSYGACQACGNSDSGSGGSSDASLGGSAGVGGTGGSGGSGAYGGAGGISGAGGATGGTSGGGSGGVATDAPYDGPTSCAASDVSNVTSGECSLSLQDCPSGLTCGLAQTDGGTWQTTCQTIGQGTKQLGEYCTGHSQCSPGLRCTVNKCTRPCCSSAEGYFCGPTGRCDLTINFGQGAATLNVCTFPIPCTPWAHDCPAAGPETDCHFNYGEFSCTFPNYSVDGGSTEGQTCTYINDCSDSQVCFYTTGATSGTCRWLCKAADAGAPDAGTVGGAPGSGGCPTGQTCKAWGQPTWLGYCSP